MFNWNQSLGRIDKTNNQPSHDARFRHTENVFGNVHTHDDVVDDVHLSLSLSRTYKYTTLRLCVRAASQV